MTLAVNIAQSGANNVTMRNRLINGSMVIDQRNAGASASLSGTGIYTLDRWNVGIAQGSGHTAQQSTSAPAGFTNSLLVTIGTGAAASSGSVARLFQPIEGFNFADMNWGTASAATITLSFWVRSSVTGTFAGGLYNAAANRTYVFTYSISSANTWEQKTVTIAGDTTGTWVGATNGIGVVVNWDLGTGSTYQGTAGSWAAGAAWATSGSVKLAATSGATWSITGVQLERGTAATAFEQRLYGTELALCKRYFQLGGGLGACYQGGATATFSFQAKIEPQMRAAPTAAIQNGTTAVVQNGRAYANINSISLVINSTPQSVYMTIVSSDTGMTANYSGEVSGQAIAFSSEL